MPPMYVIHWKPDLKYWFVAEATRSYFRGAYWGFTIATL